MNYLELLFGEGITLVQLLVWFTLGVFGVLVGVLLDVRSSGISLSQFEFKRFWRDNRFRLFLAVIMVLVAMIFKEEVTNFVGIETMSSANGIMFGAGLLNDRIIESFTKRMREKPIKKG